MKLTIVEARDLSEAFWKSCREVLLHGHEYTIDKGSFEGQKRKELDFITLHVTHPGMRPLAPDVPAGVPAPTNMETIERYWQGYLASPERQENEQYTYGEDLFDQILTVIDRYKTEGFRCNQLTMTVGSPESIRLPDPPCLRMIDTRIRYGALHFIVYFRSWDLWAGFPTNLGGIQLLKEYMAREIGVDDGELICVSKGLHLYDHCWDIARITAGLD